MTALRPLAVRGPAGRLGGWSLGDLTAGVPVLFCHPLNTEGRAWSRVAARLDRPALLPDLRGHGTATPSGPYSVDTWVDDLLAVLDETEVREVHVVGGSIGGAMAVELAARQPERVRSIASFGGTVYVADDSTQFRALLDEHGVEGTFRMLVPEVSLAPGAPAEVVDAVLAIVNRNEATVVAGILDAALATDVRDRTRLVRCPALVACGSEDRTSPPDESRIMAELLGVEPIIIEGVGHLPMIEDPARTTALLASHLAAAEA